MVKEVTGRNFLVGFPRSGTTLLQSLLVTHPEVISIPESFFFSRLVPIRQWRRLLRPPRRAMRAQLDAVAARDVRLAPLRQIDGLPAIVARQLTSRFVRALDDEVMHGDRAAWVEKTPNHLHRIPLITRHVPEARFIHIVRSGLPAIASLYAVTSNYPTQWGGARTLASCVSRWRGDIQIAHSYVGQDEHVFISYESLTSDPASILRQLLVWLKLSASDAMIEEMIAGFGSNSKAVIGDEPWKTTVGSTIINRNDARVAALFSSDEREYISHQISREEDLAATIPFL